MSQHKSTIRLIFLLGLNSYVAQSQTFEDSVRYFHSLWATQKRVEVMLTVPIKNQDVPSFRLVYDQFSRATEFLEIDYWLTYRKCNLDVLKTGTVQHQTARKIIQIQKQVARVRNYYFKKFANALTDEIALRVLEHDNEARIAFWTDMACGDQTLAKSHGLYK